MYFKSRRSERRDSNVRFDPVQTDDSVAVNQTLIHLSEINVCRPTSESGEIDNDFQSARSDDVNMTSLQPPLINAPPPSYNEVIRNSDKYKAKSS